MIEPMKGTGLNTELSYTRQKKPHTSCTTTSRVRPPLSTEGSAGFRKTSPRLVLAPGEVAQESTSTRDNSAPEELDRRLTRGRSLSSSSAAGVTGFEADGYSKADAPLECMWRRRLGRVRVPSRIALVNEFKDDEDDG